MINQGGIQFMSLKGNHDFVGFHVNDDEGNNLTIKLNLEQLKALVIEGSKILAKADVEGVTKTQYFGGDTQYTVNDY
jgi:hypothetical protein